MKLFILIFMFFLAVFPTIAQTDIEITSPMPGDELTGVVEITGTINPPDLLRYYFEVAEGNVGLNTFAIWTPVTLPNVTRVANGVLAEFDTTLVPKGIYTLRLRVISQSGNSTLYTIERLQISNEPLASNSASLQTPVSTSYPTDTLLPASMPTPTPTDVWITTSGANVRECARLDCGLVTSVSQGEKLAVVDEVIGDTFSNSRIWYEVRIRNSVGYVHSALVSRMNWITATISPTYRPTQRATQAPQAPQAQAPRAAQPTAISLPTWTLQPPPPPAQVGCPSLDYTCSQLTCEQAYACLRAGHRGLDRDSDGVPCETICPGG